MAESTTHEEWRDSHSVEEDNQNLASEDTQERDSDMPGADNPAEGNPSAGEAAADAEPDAEANVDDAEVEDEDAPELDPVAELTEDLQRITAEYANYRRRTERERAHVKTQAQTSVVSSLLPILDDLDMAALHGHCEGPLKAFSDKFTSTLTSLGLERFAEVGEPFDPSIHEAIQDTSTGDEKVLGTVVRPGYRLNGTLVRTAMVMIADPE